jgi:metallo-beta-lactamase family protein
MRISFHGAARTVTGSKHLIHLDNGKKILLDCGMFQGLGRDTLALNEDWGFDPAEVSCVILSHAHIDHVGLLPRLVKDGFAGRVFCTPQTAALAILLLRDSARIQEMEAIHINKQRERQKRSPVTPLYTSEDVENVLPLFQTIPYAEHFRIDEETELSFTDCGHVLGSGSVHLALTEHGETTRISFSGDIGRYGDMILCDPQEFPQADYIIMEATYGAKLHERSFSATDKMLSYIEETCIEKKGKLIIPAFSVGRTQEILYLLNRLDTEKRLPSVNYYVDSPLSIEATELMKGHPDCFNDQVKELLTKDDDVFAFPGLQYAQTAEESMAIVDQTDPCVIISSSGMAESGRVKHHIAQNIGDPSCTILLVGYCEGTSLGGQLGRGVKQVSIYGESHEVLAAIKQIDSMSAHGDYDDLCKWISCQDADAVKKVFLVHGEYESQLAFMERLGRKGFGNVEIPSLHQEFELTGLPEDEKDAAAILTESNNS